MMRRKTTPFTWKKLALFFKERAFVLILILCAISAISLSGIYMLEQSKEKDEINLVDLDNAIDEYGESALLEEEKEETKITEAAEATGSNVTEENYGEGDQGGTYQDVVETIIEGTDETFGDAELAETGEIQETDLADAEDTKVTEDTPLPAVTEVPASSRSVSLNFSETDLLSWPVAGNVLLDYSMDKSIYFATLDQYKYNPALVIGSQVNTQVLAAATGKVLSIDTNEEIGTTIIMELGNKYELKYGQLKEVAVEVGDLVNEGEIIGYINEPTKYYAVEGSNLYFQMTKAGTPIDPMELLK